jgi:hypothetical protein
VESATLLATMFLHFRDRKTGRSFFAMQNGIGRGPFQALYDLKGCADDKLLERDGEPIKAVHKRVWNVGMWLSRRGWSEERHRYYAGKLESRNVPIQVTCEQRSQLVECLQRDTRWLTQNRLMDYSLLVAIRSGGPAASSDSPTRLVRRTQGGNVTTHVCIIDFLQKWTFGKKVARCLKVAECNKATVPPSVYGSRFAKHFEANFEEVEEVQAPTDKCLRKGTPMSGHSTGDLGLLMPCRPVEPWAAEKVSRPAVASVEEMPEASNGNGHEANSNGNGSCHSQEETVKAKCRSCGHVDFDFGKPCPVCGTWDWEMIGLRKESQTLRSPSLEDDVPVDIDDHPHFGTGMRDVCEPPRNQDVDEWKFGLVSCGATCCGKAPLYS